MLHIANYAYTIQSASATYILYNYMYHFVWADQRESRDTNLMYP